MTIEIIKITGLQYSGSKTGFRRITRHTAQQDRKIGFGLELNKSMSYVY